MSDTVCIMSMNLSYTQAFPQGGYKSEKWGEVRNKQLITSCNKNSTELPLKHREGKIIVRFLEAVIFEPRF